jgi:hypothetical protein
VRKKGASPGDFLILRTIIKIVGSISDGLLTVKRALPTGLLELLLPLRRGNTVYSLDEKAVIPPWV